MSLDAATRARLIGLFISEAEETLATLGALAERLRTGPYGEDLSEFGRVAHGLKGAAAALGFDDLARILHDLEDLSLRLPKVDGAPRAERHGRMTEAIELLGQGIAHMAASGGDCFPQPILESLRTAVRPDDSSAIAPSADPSGSAPPSAPDAAGRPAGAVSPEPVVERISVAAAEIDAALRLASALARNAARLSDSLSNADGGAVSASAHAIAAGAEQLEASISSLRMLPAESALTGLEDEVAQLAARLGKRIDLRVAGRDVRADRRTLHAARGMIRHLVRNALDHGIETPDARRAAGKPESGKLAVTVEMAESALRVLVEDDGAGFDVSAIRREMERRAGDRDRIATMSDMEVLQLFAVQGGSTRESATEISGRGVGLSAVVSMARAAGGNFQVRAERGKGSAITFTLPLEVYSADVLTVAACDRWYGLPLQSVERLVFLRAVRDAVHASPGGTTLAVGETILPLVPLATALGAPPTGDIGRFAVVVRADERSAAFGVDEIGAAAGLVPQSVRGVAQAEALVTGLARGADVSGVAILNPRRLIEAARAAPYRAGEPAARDISMQGTSGHVPGASSRPLDVVLAEDSLATREVLRVLLEQQGCTVRLAADGEEALDRVRERVPDVLVTDIQMPRRDGLSLARQIRSEPRTARLPIIVLTSQDDESTRAAGAAAGADAYLIKSRFNASVLLETLARIGARPA